MSAARPVCGWAGARLHESAPRHRPSSVHDISTERGPSLPSPSVRTTTCDGPGRSGTAIDPRIEPATSWPPARSLLGLSTLSVESTRHGETRTTSHSGSWTDCIRSREPPVDPVSRRAHHQWRAASARSYESPSWSSGAGASGHGSASRPKPQHSMSVPLESSRMVVRSGTRGASKPLSATIGSCQSARATSPSESCTTRQRMAQGKSLPASSAMQVITSATSSPPRACGIGHAGDDAASAPARTASFGIAASHVMMDARS